MRRLFPTNAFVPAKMGTAERLVIAEAPGETEAILLEPLVGGSGRTFDAVCHKAGISRDELTLTNCISCRPPENVYPTDAAARSYISEEDAQAATEQCWRNHLKPLVLSRPWKRIDLLGAKALERVAELEGGIFRWRGSPVPVPCIDSERPLAVPTLHPSYLSRDQLMFPVAVSDMRKSLVIPPEDKYVCFPTLAQVQAFKADTLFFDIETTWGSTDITMVGVAARPFEPIVIPFKGAFIPELKRIFREARELVGHNCVQFDLPILAAQNVEPSPEAQIWDTMLLHHLCFPQFGKSDAGKEDAGKRQTEGGHSLGFCGSQLTNKPAWKTDKDVLELYCARDVDVTAQIFQQLLALIRFHKLEDTYKLVSYPLAKICYLMHRTGIKLDPRGIERVREELEKEQASLELLLPACLRTQEIAIRRRQPAPPGTISAKTKKPLKFLMVDDTETIVPWRSDKLVGAYLYDELKLEKQLHVKSQKLTTDKTALTKLFHRTGLRSIDAIRRLRSLDETLTTFAKEGMTYVERMHPHFNVHGTASGRLSSSDPNLQNIPVSVRGIYVPSHPGWVLVSADYSQIENRLTAWFAGDAERLERFATNPDFNEHKWVTSQFFGIPYEKVEKSNDNEAPYHKGKRINHGKNYRMGPVKISRLYDLPLKEVKLLCDIWDRINAKTVQWQNAVGAEAQTNGKLTNPFGRKGFFYTEKVVTESASFLPQSTAADVLFRATIGLMYRRIGWPEELAARVSPVLAPLPEPARLLLSIHDQLVLECPSTLVDAVVRCLRAVMEQPWAQLGNFVVPASVEVGPNWKDLAKYKGE